MRKHYRAEIEGSSEDADAPHTRTEVSEWEEYNLISSESDKLPRVTQ